MKIVLNLLLCSGTNKPRLPNKCEHTLRREHDVAVKLLEKPWCQEPAYDAKTAV